MKRIKFEKETHRGSGTIISTVPGHSAFLKLIKGKRVDDVYQFSAKDGMGPYFNVNGQIGFKDGSVVMIIHSAREVILRYRK